MFFAYTGFIWEPKPAQPYQELPILDPLQFFRQERFWGVRSFKKGGPRGPGLGLLLRYSLVGWVLLLLGVFAGMMIVPFETEVAPPGGVGGGGGGAGGDP